MSDETRLDDTPAADEVVDAPQAADPSSVEAPVEESLPAEGSQPAEEAAEQPAESVPAEVEAPTEVEAPAEVEAGSLEEAEAAMDDEPAEEVALAPAGPIEELSEDDLAEDIKIDWYILKVQSNRERTSSEALKRKVAIEGLDRYFGEIIVPTEKVTEFKNGKKKTVSRKIWPGYIAVQMHVNDDTWFAIRETSGIGDFTGASGKPIPMSPSDVEKILPKEETEEGGEDDAPKLNIKFAEGDKVKVTDGNFESFEGDVDSIDQQSGKITVMISIFGRSTPVELEYWQVEKL